MHVGVMQRLPRRGDVLREQFLSVGLSLRREGVVVGALAGMFTLFILGLQAGTSRPLEFGVSPEGGIAMAALALLLPMAVWKGEGPGQRGYHRAMPVAHGEHAVARALSGLAWLMAAAVAYFAWLGMLAALTGGTFADVPAWVWGAPFAGAAVLYLLGSALTLRVAHPWRWLGGGAVAYVFLASWGAAASPHGRAGFLEAVVFGRLGLGSVVTGSIPSGLRKPAFHYDFGVWLLAAWLWAAVAISLFLWSAYRQPEG